MDGSGVQRVGIVGAGTIGASWAAFYASRGIHVSLYDADPQACARGLERAAAQLADLRRLGLLQRPGRVAAAGSIEEVAAGAALVHEAVSESYEAKVPLFSRLDGVADPGTVLASSSSGLLMTRVQAEMRRPGRSLIAHPFNPPHLVPLVELVGGERTDPQTLAWARAFYAGLGKVPVVLRQEVPGHLANRLAAALWREALDLVARGVASVEDVDRALCAGPGLRWALMGQHLIYHLGGGAGGYRHFIDHIGSGWSPLWTDMATWTQIPPQARQAALDGMEEAMAGRSAAELSAWRDGKLAALLRLLDGEHGGPR
ncbi:MAG: 3-hydroxyacyl-CoA dehydrogenase NAD-binding domain-containing protein [Candidatus Latescibacterota bacterium]